MALFKKGKKGAGGKMGPKKGKKQYGDMQGDPRADQYDSMITPRNEAQMGQNQNLEALDEQDENEEDIVNEDGQHL